MLGTVLIADGLATNRILLKARLAPMQYRVIQAERADLASAALSGGGVALALVSANLPGGGAQAVAQALRAVPRAQRAALIVLTDADAAPDRHRHLGAGADDVLPRGTDDLILQARIRSLIRARQGEDAPDLGKVTSAALGFAEGGGAFAGQARVALIAADPGLAAIWHRRLAPRLSAHLGTCGFAQALTMATRDPAPDAFVIGLSGPEVRTGLRLLADLRARPATRDAAVIALLDRADGVLAAEALDLGASDLMLAGFDAEELALRLSAQIAAKRDRDRLRATMETGLRAAVIDPMTGLYNRRYALPHLAEALGKSRASGAYLAVMLADLDHFKRVNDAHGHAAGDAVLVETARRLQAAAGEGSLVARVGGEEFLIVCPGCDALEAAQVAERLRLAVSAQPIRPEGGVLSLRVTISIGLVATRGQGLAPVTSAEAQSLIAQADRALYKAKGAGRNKITAVVSAA